MSSLHGACQSTPDNGRAESSHALKRSHVLQVRRAQHTHAILTELAELVGAHAPITSIASTESRLEKTLTLPDKREVNKHGAFIASG
ncbi:uncharacterized protein LAESUDRAFT_765280 [Laetiporus sulphureus 93-53]|uniref:Uncharacterized protein n=1 Tax=Laetiporus sulphureus 93-53 TaxID=1314785 RepID=A0A165AUA7_9APHY|nr:uncharacterized protein LAESUDRAFT_765280 [Laetiporus sulphureus 93-53]KZS99676.1 hypothetical protein LAESUDRAFT_765280 [Laetiporus sulphureus 93-53]